MLPCSAAARKRATASSTDAGSACSRRITRHTTTATIRIAAKPPSTITIQRVRRVTAASDGAAYSCRTLLPGPLMWHLHRADMREVEHTDTRAGSELDRLKEEERSLSIRRQRLHDRIDFLRGGGGGESPEAAQMLADLEREEREVSQLRRELHQRIDGVSQQHAGPRLERLS